MPHRQDERLRDPRVAFIVPSLFGASGRGLPGTRGGSIPSVDSLWDLPVVVLAHGIEDDPLFFFANRRAHEVFGYPEMTLIGMPSRLSAEAPDRAARAALLDEVARNGFIENYSGMRVRADGSRFEITRATVWNLKDGDGAICGQAAAFVA